MKNKEAIIKTLEEYGGRAELSAIYPRVIQLADFKKGSDIKATIRTTLQRNPHFFRPSKCMKGVWELVSFQEEIASRDERIKELEEENEKLKSVESADSFVERLVEATKKMFAAKRYDAKSVQQVLLVLQRMKEQQELLEWIVSKPAKENKKSATKKVVQNISNSQVFNGSITDSEFNGGTNNE